MKVMLWIIGELADFEFKAGFLSIAAFLPTSASIKNRNFATAAVAAGDSGGG